MNILFVAKGMCIWNSLMGTTFTKLRRLNGVYDIVDSSRTGTDRRWMLDDWDKINSICSINQSIWYNNESPGRWFAGTTNIAGGRNSDCFCNQNDLSTFTSDDCDPGNMQCFLKWSFIPVNQSFVSNEKIMSYFGTCPELTDVCSTITVDAPSPYDICNGDYNAVTTPPNGFINEMNIFENRNSSARNKYIYFDHSQFRWLCGSIYSPCSNDFLNGANLDGTLLYKGGQNNVGTPSWFSGSDGSITITSGGTFTVEEWGDNVDPSGTATFTCNPPLPTMDPTTAEPTSPITAEPTTSEPTTSSPTTSQPTTSDPTTAEPTTAEPTTINPTTAEPTTAMPTTSMPTTYMPTTSMPTTSEPTTKSPTRAPLDPGQTNPPTEDPTTSAPTTSMPTTPDPTSADPTTAEPTTDEPTSAMPSRSPLGDGETYRPTDPPTATPTSSAPTTDQPTAADPTTTAMPTGSPTEYKRDDDDDPPNAAPARNFSTIAIALLFVYLLFI